MRVWPWKIGELGYILGYTTHFWGTCSLGQSWFSSDVTWDNDCAIPHYDCAISNYDCAISYLLSLAQNSYLESSISRKNAFIIDGWISRLTNQLIQQAQEFRFRE